jgi:hypothetical protein
MIRVERSREPRLWKAQRPHNCRQWTVAVVRLNANLPWPSSAISFVHVHVCDVGISQIGILFEEFHPRLEKLAPPAGHISTIQANGGWCWCFSCPPMLHNTHGWYWTREPVTAWARTLTASRVTGLKKQTAASRRPSQRRAESRKGNDMVGFVIRTCRLFPSLLQRIDVFSDGSSPLRNRQHLSALSIVLHGKGDARPHVVLPFNLRFSPRNPTSWSALLRTKLTMTASFSRP